LAERTLATSRQVNDGELAQFYAFMQTVKSKDYKQLENDTSQRKQFFDEFAQKTRTFTTVVSALNQGLIVGDLLGEAIPRKLWAGLSEYNEAYQVMENGMDPFTVAFELQGVFLEDEAVKNFCFTPRVLTRGKS
jgi:hypothetical protein